MTNIDRLRTALNNMSFSKELTRDGKVPYLLCERCKRKFFGRNQRINFLKHHFCLSPTAMEIAIINVKNELLKNRMEEEDPGEDQTYKNPLT